MLLISCLGRLISYWFECCNSYLNVWNLRKNGLKIMTEPVHSDVVTNDHQILTKKEKRARNKRKKLVAEYQLVKSNEEDNVAESNAPEPKKLRIEPKDGVQLTQEEYKELKKELAQRKRTLQQTPRFNLQNSGLSASLYKPNDIRVPILMSDVQQLLLYAACGNSVIPPPSRWCGLQKPNRLTNIIVLLIDGVTMNDFYTYEYLLPNLTHHFTNRVEMVAPCYYGSNSVTELTCVPLTSAQKQMILNKYGTLEAAVAAKDIIRVMRTIFPINPYGYNPMEKQFKLSRLPPSDIFPRTFLLLNLDQLALDGFPLPYTFSKYDSFYQPYGPYQKNPPSPSSFNEFKMTQDVYLEVNNRSPMFSIDCEMIGTVDNRQDLARVAVVNESLEVVYESFVKPTSRITNYLTQYSGITKELLEGVTTTLADVQKKIHELLPKDAILVGHSLNCDLKALKMFHPYVIDTSVIFNIHGVPGKKAKLLDLAYEFLGEEIQKGEHGHCPVEDALTTMKLVKLKLARGFAFGDCVISANTPNIPESILCTSFFNHTHTSKKSVSVISSKDTLKEYKELCPKESDSEASPKFHAVECQGSKDRIKNLSQSAVQHNMSICHFDVSDKVEGSEGEKTEENNKEKTFKKINKWCDKAFNFTYVNGMCVVVFTGSKEAPEEGNKNEEKAEAKTSSCVPDDSVNNEKVAEKNEEIQKESSSSEKEGSETRMKYSSVVKMRQNGACFVHVKSRN